MWPGVLGTIEDGKGGTWRWKILPGGQFPHSLEVVDAKGLGMWISSAGTSTAVVSHLACGNFPAT